MAETKNTFMASKMNKDIDARLIPKGEYRDAVNITVSRSEGDDVGTVQNIKGNIQISDFGLTDKHLEIIGYYVDEQKDLIYFFITNYTDASVDYLSNFAPSNSAHYIYSYNADTNTVNQLVSGNFLNFSKTHPIGGVDIIEDLLFFTDNRNQPRKINITTALANPNYYTTEDHISVTKYYPFEPIDLYKEEVQSVSIINGGQNYQGLNLPYQIPANGLVGGTGEGLILTITSISPVTGEISGIEITNPGTGYTNGDVLNLIVRLGVPGSGGQFEVFVTGISTMKNRSDEYLPPEPDGTSNPNPDYDENWPGDPEYLKERFIRFSYRFKFDDDEYSLIAPFTQIAFVPRNDGYFLNETYDPSTGDFIDGDNDEYWAFSSTENRLMRNKIDEVGLILPAPSGFSSWADAVSGLKIKEVDIISKDASEISIKVLDTIDNSTLVSTNIDKLQYIYQSRKPTRTLPDSEVVRVYDKSPIRAKTLTAVGNRILYSNFYDKHTSPTTLNYNTNVNEKDSQGSNIIAIEYQNHTLKDNRTYQVGIVLSDRYGRSSDVILSEVDDGVVAGLSDSFKGSTLYKAYRNESSVPLDTTTPSNASWPGDLAEVIFKSQIPSSINTPGYPGLYSITNPLGWYSFKIVIKQQEQEYYNAYLPGIVNGAINKDGSSSDTEATISLYSDNINKIPKDISQVGPSQTIYRSAESLNLRVVNEKDALYHNSVQFFGGPVDQKVSQISELSNLGISIAKKSLKQTGPATEPAGTTTFTFSTFDEDIQPGSSVVNVIDGGTQKIDASENFYVKAYYAVFGGSTLVLNTGTTVDISVNSTWTFGPPGVVFNSNNNPLIGILATTEAVGVAEETGFIPYLAIGETQPFESNLDIFYETTSSGLISVLNESIIDGDTTTPVGLSDPQFAFFENEPPGSGVTIDMTTVNNDGVEINDPNASFNLISVEDALGDPVDIFELVDNNNGTFYIRLTNDVSNYNNYFGQNSQIRNYTFTVRCVVLFQTVDLSFTGAMSNLSPISVIAAGQDGVKWKWGLFEFDEGPIYGNQIYVGSFTTGSQLTSDTDYTGSGASTSNGSSTNALNDNKYSELKVENLTISYVGGTNVPTAYNGSGVTIELGQARINNPNGPSVGQVDPTDDSVTGLGLFINNPITATPVDLSSGSGQSLGFCQTRWHISYDLVDANGSGLRYEVVDEDLQLNYFAN
tara:strand:- start:14964 stop:18557 length:3594 start_codon:yes stop_codon:yes gene_type:complete